MKFQFEGWNSHTNIYSYLPSSYKNYKYVYIYILLYLHISWLEVSTGFLMFVERSLFGSDSLFRKSS